MIEDETLEVRGRNLVTGLPKTVTVTSTETEEALPGDNGTDRRSCYQRAGENTTGAFRRYP